MIPIRRLSVSAYTVPTSSPESDGTLEWNKTTLVLVELWAGDVRGLGYTYASRATAQTVHEVLAREIIGRDAFAIEGAWSAMVRAIRNLGRAGIDSMAISAVDVALWDLKSRLLGIPLITLLGAARESIVAYGSGGFTSYSVAELERQLGHWVAHGFDRVKMKIGRDPEADIIRVRAARNAIGAGAELYVDANGAYSRKLALKQAAEFAAESVSWFEEPVPSDDLEGLRLIRDRAPAGMDIAAGEYGYDLHYFRRMLDAGSVDVLQADATRCGGITGFFQVDALCQAHDLKLSAHTAPTLHAPLMCATLSARDVEYFHDHARIESMLFDGAITARKGQLAPDLSRPGLGIEFKRKDAEKYAAA